MKIYGFKKGGILLKDIYAPSESSNRIAFLPALSVIPMIQHSGKPCQPIVEPGERVREGQLLGSAQAPGQADIHSPIPGVVLKSIIWRMPDGRSSPTLIIKLEGSFEKLGRMTILFDWKKESANDIIKNIVSKGLVEMEEPGRPIAELLANSPRGGVGNTIALRAVFDDPWQAAERAVLLDRPNEVAEGLAIAAKAARTSTVVIVATKRDVNEIQPIIRAVGSYGLDCLKIFVRDRYPCHFSDELNKILSKAIRDGNYAGKPPVFLSASTLLAIREAISSDKPLIERYVAIGGSAVKAPAVLRLRLGTRIGDAIAECGGLIDSARRIVLGAPLTAFAVDDLDTPITKTVSAVVAMGFDQKQAQSEAACIACGACRNICPVGLDPERLYKLALNERNDEAIAAGASCCHGCACCAAVCPSRLPLPLMIRLAARKSGSSVIKKGVTHG